MSDGVERQRLQPGDTRARRVATLGTAAICVASAVSVLQIVVLNPLAAVPGRSLRGIHADVAAAGESLDVPVTLLITAAPLVVALVLLGRARRRPVAPERLTSAYLVLLAALAPVQWWAGFGPGIALADTYGISGGDHSPWGLPVYAAAVAALVALSVRDVHRRPAAPAAAGR